MDDDSSDAPIDELLQVLLPNRALPPATGAEAHVAAAALVLERLRSGPLDQRESLLAVMILGQLGAVLTPAALEAVVRDPAAHPSGRAVPLLLAPMLGPALVGLPSQAIAATAEARYALRFLTLLPAPSLGANVATDLKASQGPERALRLALIEGARVRAGLPAALCYHGVLRQPALAQLRPDPLAHIAAEGGLGARLVLEDILRHAAADHDAREVINRAREHLCAAPPRVADDLRAGHVVAARRRDAEEYRIAIRHVDDTWLMARLRIDAPQVSIDGPNIVPREPDFGEDPTFAAQDAASQSLADFAATLRPVLEQASDEGVALPYAMLVLACVLEQAGTHPPSAPSSAGAS
jgi:hypothetical protein